MEINVVHDCTQRELINDITRIIATGMGSVLDNETEVTESTHPRTIQYAQIAVDIFAAIVGDTPSYDDDVPVDPLLASRYFQAISFDAFERKGDIQPIVRHKFVEGVGVLPHGMATCFAEMVGGKTNFRCQGSYAIDPADPIYVYLVDAPYELGRHSYYVATNFDVARYQLALGLESTVHFD